jgi:hypothetical protein
LTGSELLIGQRELVNEIFGLVELLARQGELINEIFGLVEEADRRCNELRVGLVLGEIVDGKASSEYARATAPLASAARRIKVMREEKETA